MEDNIFLRFWKAFLSGISYMKQAFKGGPPDTHIQEYTDIHKVNWLAMVANKLCNLACNEATFDVVSDSTLADNLKDKVKDIEAHRFEITNGMLANGDFYIFPSTDDKSELYHSYLSADRVRIVEMKGEKITEAYAILDYIQPVKNSTTTYMLQRHHKLQDGVLTISYSTRDENGNEVTVPYWNDVVNIVIQYSGVDNIGFGRYKSPKDGRGLSAIYGVPLNFGCCEIENELNETLKQIKTEFSNAQSKIFADPRTLMKKPDRDEYKLAENIYPYKITGGNEAKQIQIYNPNIRASEHYERLEKALKRYEQAIGVSAGLISDSSATANATATEVRRSNSDTIAFINSIHTALDNGNEMTLKADSMYLTVSPDIWEYKSDYLDPFSDQTSQWQMLIQAKQEGAAEAEDLARWLFPGVSEEEIAEKMERINQAKSATAQNALENALMM